MQMNKQAWKEHLGRCSLGKRSRLGATRIGRVRTATTTTGLCIHRKSQRRHHPNPTEQKTSASKRAVGDQSALALGERKRFGKPLRALGDSRVSVAAGRAGENGAQVDATRYTIFSGGPSGKGRSMSGRTACVIHHALKEIRASLEGPFISVQ